MQRCKFEKMEERGRCRDARTRSKVEKARTVQRTKEQRTTREQSRYQADSEAESAWARQQNRGNESEARKEHVRRPEKTVHRRLMRRNEENTENTENTICFQVNESEWLGLSILFPLILWKYLHEIPHAFICVNLHLSCSMGRSGSALPLCMGCPEPSYRAVKWYLEILI
jgi:hypothetical protein